MVTGASRGIGKAIALGLADAGADVAVNYRERGQNAQAVADAISKLGRRSTATCADVSDGEAVKSMMVSIQAKLGPVDVLVNNAGIALHRGLDDLTEADFDRTIAVNLKSAFLCTQAVLAHMRTQHWGRIVNISSGAARGATVNSAGSLELLSAASAPVSPRWARPPLPRSTPVRRRSPP